MTATNGVTLGSIHDLLARKRYAVTDVDANVLRIQEVESGIALRGVLEGDILYLSLTCAVAPESSITPQLTRKMLAADNGISTSYFQLHQIGDGNIAVTLNNFCKLQDLNADDEDDILSCVSFLLADVVFARDLIAADLK
jgi:hypothetical protein